MSTPDLITNEEKAAYLAALERAIMRGVTAFSYAGDSVSYRSFSEMQKVRAWLRFEMGRPLRAVKLPPRRIVVRM